MLKNRAKTGKLNSMIFNPVDSFLDKISNGYAKLVGWAVIHRKTVILSALGIFIFVLAVLGPGIKTEFFPTADQGRITVKVELPVGTEQSVTAAFSAKLAERLRNEIPEIKILQYNFGQASSSNTYGNLQATGSNIMSMNINLGSMELRKRSASEIMEIIRQDLRDYPEIKKATVSEGMGGMGSSSTVNVELYGYDFEETDRVARELQEKMLNDKNFSQVTLSRDDYTPGYQVDFDRTKLALNGLNSTMAAAAFSAAMKGSVNSFYREEGDEYNIRVRFAKEFRNSIEDIENIIVYNPMSKGIKIKELGSVEETRIPPTIERKNRERAGERLLSAIRHAA